MGTKLCYSKDREEDKEQNQLVAVISYRTSKIQIISGDSSQEHAEILVKFVISDEMNLKIGEMFIQQQFENPIIKTKAYIRIPFYMGTENLSEYYEIYQKILSQINGNFISIEDPSSIKNPIPKQYNAEVLIRAIIKCIDTNTNVIKRINIISANMNNCKVFRYEFEKIVQETKNPELYKERNQKFQQFINPTESFILNAEMEAEENRKQYENISLQNSHTMQNISEI